MMDAKAVGRKKIGSEDKYQLSEPAATYAHFECENGDVVTGNTYL